MNNNGRTLNCEQGRDFDMVDYLAQIGHHPVKISGDQYWYLSPIRQEKNASFKVNRKLNRWIDFGDGRKGNLIDFGIIYHQCEVKEFLEGLQGQPINKIERLPHLSTKEKSPQVIFIIKEEIIQSLDLIRYLNERRISLQIAKQYCREITYSVRGGMYRAIAFKNDDGGYELRTANFKGSNAPKTLTTIKSNSKELLVFEGFFDMLTFCTIKHQQRKSIGVDNHDIVVLNSLSFAPKLESIIRSYEQVNLFLNNDSAGQRCRDELLAKSPKIEDKSSMYRGYKDLNEWACHMGKKNTATRNTLIHKSG